jgi:hypothetical protein
MMQELDLIPCTGNIFSSSPKCPESEVTPAAYPVDTRGSLPGYKAAGGISWPLNLVHKLKVHAQIPLRCRVPCVDNIPFTVSS